MARHRHLLTVAAGALGATLVLGASPSVAAGRHGLASPGTTTDGVHDRAVATPAVSGGTTGCSTLVEGAVTWVCTFDSEFSGTSLNSAQWAPVTTAGSGYTYGRTACYVDSPNNISVGNGYLSLTVRQESQPFDCKGPRGSFRTTYTSGTIATVGMFSQTYGRFEVMAKVPDATVAGLQSSFWLFPVTQKTYGRWPNSGEIDIAETYSRFPDTVTPYIHYRYRHQTADPATNTNIVTSNCTMNPGAFNDYVAEWTPSTITIFVNGSTCLVDNWVPSRPLQHPEPFDQPFFINLTQALGMGPNAFDPGTTPLPATTEVQFVRVWTAQ
ncbi:MAG TPA: glycoside hydrolase family 16 protein [Acidimicrobiales bacterium]|nr:glycoside hydrolase family 16 protein [Acidimicrobiales bacterium]